MKNLILIPLISFTCLTVFASEIDSFTLRSQTLADASNVVNQKANELLNVAISRANRGIPCNEIQFYNELRKEFNNHSKGTLAKYIIATDEFQKHTISRSQSIYKHHTIRDGFLLARKSADKSGTGMGTTMNYNGHYIGSDKFEHMFGQGYFYFNDYYNNEEPLEIVLQKGISRERLQLGGNSLATGVFSYSDLVANFNGMRFWNAILQKNDDILGENLGPYVVCENNLWVQKTQIDFRNYIDAAFDEGMHCSALATQGGFQGVSKSLSDSRQACPLDPSQVEALKAKYDVSMGKGKKIRQFIMNPTNTTHQYKSGWFR